MTSIQYRAEVWPIKWLWHMRIWRQYLYTSSPLAFHTKRTSKHIDLASQGRLYGTCFPITRIGLFLWHSLRENTPDWPPVMTEKLSGGKFVGRVGELPAFKHAVHSERQIYRLRSSTGLSVFALSPVADWRPCSPNKNTVRDSSARHEIDFVLTNKGICFSHTVNQIISRNEGKMRLKSLTSNSKSGSLPTCCPINPETCSIAN